MFRVTEEGIDIPVHNSGKPFHTTDNIEEYIEPVQTIENKPLTRISVTHLPEGSVLAVSLSHALVDGFSIFHFMSSWARITRGERILSPHIPRDIFPQFIQTEEREITQKEIYEQCGLFLAERRSDIDLNDLVTVREPITSETIKTYTEEVKRTHNIPVSENDVITAYLWKKYLPDWLKVNETLKVYITCPFDFRRVLNGFPKNYFGCALSFATAETTLDNLINSPIGDIAMLIKKSVGAIKDEYIRQSLSSLDQFRRRNGIEGMEHIHLRHPERGMIVTNISRLPLRDLDFGNGRPAGFLTYAEVGNSAAILPAENGVEAYVVFFR
jgi:hypothetical protein